MCADSGLGQGGGHSRFLGLVAEWGAACSGHPAILVLVVVLVGIVIVIVVAWTDPHPTRGWMVART